jgi:GAF domain-containing protein
LRACRDDDERPRTAVADAPTAAMARVARTLQGEHNSIEETLQAVIAAAVDVVPGAGSAGVTLAAGRKTPETWVASDDLARRIEALQAQAAQGPGLEASREQRSVRVDDVATDQRWPRFAASAAVEGVVSVLSFPLSLYAGRLGALSLYSRASVAFTQRSEDIGSAFASHASLAIVSAQREAGLLVAVDHRDLIGQAKGILMERHKVTADQAFQLLVRASQHSNVPLYDVAFELAATGVYPELRRSAVRAVQPAAERSTSNQTTLPGGVRRE